MSVALANLQTGRGNSSVTVIAARIPVDISSMFSPEGLLGLAAATESSTGVNLRKKGELDRKTIEGILYLMLNDVFGEMDADNDRIQAETKKSNYNDLLDGSRKTYYIVSYDEICNRFMREVDGVSLSRCREVFGGIYDNIGRDKEKRKALAFNKDSVKETGESFEIVSEIKILDQDELFEDRLGLTRFGEL